MIEDLQTQVPALPPLHLLPRRGIKGPTLESRSSGSQENPISEGIPLPRVVLKRSTQPHASSQRQPEQPALDQDTNQSSSSGYSLSPPNLGTMTRQPLNLSSLLTVSSQGRGSTARASSTGHVPLPPRRTRGVSTRSSSSPLGSDTGVEAEDAHRDKRPRNQEAGETLAQAAGSGLNPHHLAPAWSIQLGPPSSFEEIVQSMLGTLPALQRLHWPLHKAYSC